MKISFLLVLFLGGFLRLTDNIRCYKCDAELSECKTISSKTYDYASENVEVIDCEYFCWKSISLGKYQILIKFKKKIFFIIGNVYRGCAAKRRCAGFTYIGYIFEQCVL